jgi:cytochrome c2
VKAGPHAVDPGPAYLIWENPLKNEDESGFPWPYQVVRIEMLSKTAVMKALQPPGLTGVDTGAALFRDRCLKCHNSHGVGGTMGPDLRAMLKTVGDWKAEKLALFIQHPKKVIPASKMADMADLSQAALSSIVDYLRAIKTNQL